MLKLTKYAICVAIISFSTVLADKGWAKLLFAKRIGKKIVRVTKKAVLGHNFHIVEEGCFRSRQLNAKELDSRMKTHSIKTVINLRGREDDQKWWQEEKRVVDENGGVLFDIAMDASVVTPLEKLQELAVLLLVAPGPVLIHCDAGSDITGEAAAFYKLLRGRSTKEALGQLSLRYGHASIYFPKKKSLIKNIHTIYPDFLIKFEQIKRLPRFTVDEIRGLTSADICKRVEGYFRFS